MSWIKFKEGKSKKEEQIILGRATPSSSKNKLSIQDSFLNEMMKNKKAVTMYLNNGIRLQGVIEGYDQYVISLPYEGKNQLIYKSSISTIQGVKSN